jgi:hypothetical protein
MDKGTNSSQWKEEICLETEQRRSNNITFIAIYFHTELLGSIEFSFRSEDPVKDEKKVSFT